ncbi:MAG: DUF362 domain-containing protein [Candidatus Pacearchaeota archaeon]|nr:DUF362 domain-containing protein [Candidatus Pacearchaeota archaeon]
MKVAKIEVDDLKSSVKKAVNEIGGFSNFVKKDDVVLLKINANTADEYPASSDLDFLRVVVKFVLEEGAKEVLVGDASTVYAKTKKQFEKMKLYSLEELDSCVKIINFDEGEFVKKEIPNGEFLKSVYVSEVLDRVDKLILLPCLKTHFLAKFTGSLKLSVGFMRPLDKLKFHVGHLEEKIAELNKIIHPDLIVMDARKCFIDKGPTCGNVRKPNFILASKSRVGIDTEGVKIIKNFKGNTLKDVNVDGLVQIKKAREFGVK